MPEEQFVSRYAEIGYKLPGTHRVLRFNNGRYSTSDSKEIEYLKGHQDFGSTLTTGKIPAKAVMLGGLDLCPVCGKGFADPEEFRDHLVAHIMEGKELPAKGPAARALAAKEEPA